MSSKIDKSQFSQEEKSDFQRTRKFIKAFVRGRLDHDYKDLIVDINADPCDFEGKPYILEHNASFSLSGSYKLANEIDHFLQSLKLPECAVPYTLNVSLKFTEKEPMPSNNPQGDAPAQFHPRKPLYSLSQVILPDEIKQQVKELLTLVKNRKLIYDDWGFREIDPVAKGVINLYGPPGTGKTMLANAIANELGCDMLACNYAEIESKYVGDSAKNLMAAFNTARETGSLLFFDEADSFLGKRIENVSHGHDQAINSFRSQMLILLEEFEGVVVFATNLVTNFDHAFESRILKHIKLDLPNREARAAIIRKMLPAKLPVDEVWSDEQLLEASDLIEGLSGREIKGGILEMLLVKATSDGMEAKFTIDDLKAALKHKKEMIEQLKKEETERKKNRILNKLQEQSMENDMKGKEKNSNKKSSRRARKRH